MAAAAAGDENGFRAAWEAMAQAARGLDHQQMLNAMHVPEDAGEHAEALAAILRRIPDGWGRWISCDRGWYALIVELDGQLSALLPSYVLHQAKEKFGGLRYYWESGEEIHDPGDPEPSTPGREGHEEAWARWSREHDAWSERLDRYLQTPEGKRRTADLESRVALAERLVDAAEKRASVSCELCGAPGRLHRTRSRYAWYKTLCGNCAEQANYVPAQEESSG
ncbi:MAG TPA: hypothetical protein VMD79_03980 [Solirubrobacteraceae bacterium]|nr:hypothetical protein [Solirubrobacteraceae bacterium]